MTIGVAENSNWGGAWINDYLFSRLEFVKRNCDKFRDPKHGISYSVENKNINLSKTK